MGAPLATVLLNPGGWFAWLIVGLLAGAVAGTLVRGRGYGCLVDIIVGIVGAFIGGILVGLVLPSTTFGFVGSLVVSILGAIILLAFIRLVSPRRA
ncbi:MAG TPA: GlsB/YeaQ/YmgE family stress response membrane protein [Candidatus Dormibacteraeota bacterium]|nr:GlsB/YeaQ/YmgE family stress response membrane protein [Candidatus Dormibacteraeota bacterium]